VHREVTIAGFGGQGIMLAGKLLAQAGLDEGREVVWLPSYGPEMRGGTAYCNVVISDNPIGSPVFSNPSSAVVMNRPSLEKFGPRVKEEGLLIINKSLIEIDSDREDIDVLHVECNQIAIEAGTGKAANMVALGAYVGRSGAVKLETVRELIAKSFAHKPKVIDINLDALQRGYDVAKQN
jgi:2-oxoglutarate ferredoxin oxidoreductase subunit gamma